MRLVFLAFMLLTFSGCGLVSSFKIRDAFLNEQIALDSFKKEIPFQVLSGAIVIKVMINGIEENFVFDSAATTTIAPELSRRLNYTPLGKKKTFDSNNKKKHVKYVTLDGLEVAGVSFHSIVASISDLKKFKELACLDISGVLGVNVMNKGVWQIDFMKSKIIFTDNIDSLNLTGDESKVNFYSTGKGVPEISLRSDNVYLGEAKLDTGCNGSILLNENESLSSSNFVEKQYYSTGAFSSEANRQRILRISNLQFGNSFKMSNSLVTLNERKMAYNLIGTLFLKDYITTIDWTNQQIFLAQSDGIYENKFDGFGIHPRLYNDEILVGSIYLNSSAYEQGIRLNDKILMIDEMSFDKDNHEKYCDLRAYLKNRDINSILVVVQRGEMILEFNLERSNLIDALSKNE